MDAERFLHTIHQLVPAIRERTKISDRLRRLPDETVDDFVANRLIKALMPAEVGGFDLGFPLIGKAIHELAKADASAGWVFGVYVCHNWIAAMFDMRAQKEIWEERGFALIAGPINPFGRRARRMNGGYRITGRWPFGSVRIMRTGQCCLFGRV